MDFLTVWRQLVDLPSTFRREGTPYTWLTDSITSGLYLFCQALDALQQQYNFNTAQEGWIDVWGALAGFTRNTDEPNDHYQERIQQTILAWRDSTTAIEKFISVVENTQALVFEHQPTGYTIYFQTLTDLNQIQKIVYDLRYVRPAGVPFDIQSQIGTYLDTVNYYGTIGINPAFITNQSLLNGPAVLGSVVPPPLIGRVTGAYLTGTEPIRFNIPATTNSGENLLPTLLMTDPTLNPHL